MIARSVALCMLCLALACGPSETIRNDTASTRGIAPGAAQPSVIKPKVVTRPAVPAAQAEAKPLPVLGDPYGLLSKTPPAQKKQQPAEPATLDPGALSRAPGEVEQTTEVIFERDPRAVARGKSVTQSRSLSASVPARSAAVRIEETSAASVMHRMRQTAGPQVLLLYASYCPGCRASLPDFLKLVQRYQQRGVRFTAASIDRDPSSFSDYASNLQGMLDPLWIVPDGTTRDELGRAGMLRPDGGFSIPLYAVYKSRRLTAQPHGLSEVRKLLDGML